MFTLLQKTKNPIYLLGLTLIICSFGLFLIPEFAPALIGRTHGSLFIINYLITVGFFIILLLNRKYKKSKSGLNHWMLFLILFLISAYSLNREMGVFEKSVTWFCVTLIVVCLNYILMSLFDKIPLWLKILSCFIAGTALVVFAYLAIYLVPIYLISGVIFFGLGFSLHAFVPILFCIATIKLIRPVISGKALLKIPFIAGITAPIVFTAVYVISWSNDLKYMNHYFQYSSITENNQLPPWMTVAQHMHKSGISEKILKTDLIYAVPDFWEANFLRFPKLNFEQRAHDPLVMTSSFICGKLNLPEEKRIKILETLYDSRHQAQERLWSGEDIRTERVSNHVQLWPELRLSYTQLDLTITHVPNNDSWNTRQEAIYTFHVPEGGVVTSLSLWIDGNEEKGILTSKAKADSAYTTIVGVENRDPSVVHWQEGNTVTVRVFPVLEGESRKFKIGITAPLSFTNGRLRYDNIYFDGPSFRSAEESVSIDIKTPTRGLTLPIDFNHQNNEILHDGAYQAVWSVAFDAPPVSNEAFGFDNYSYRIIPTPQVSEKFVPSSVYLDINASWTAAQCEKVYELTKSKKTFVSRGTESFTLLTAENKDRLFKELLLNQFSVFPFFKIADDANPLVITHNGSLSPTIADMRDSRFMQQTSSYFKNGRVIRIYDLGNELSPYLKSLKEFRVLHYCRGNEAGLENILTKNNFNRLVETENSVAVESAGISIQRTCEKMEGTAPDHLMRLYAYNHILQQSGRALLSNSETDTAIVQEAQQAYVVSPVSSLVVLETQKDYDRFDISASKNSLQNASLQSKGAVPEPGEWALIIMIVVVCLYALYSHKFSYKLTK